MVYNMRKLRATATALCAAGALAGCAVPADGATEPLNLSELEEAISADVYPLTTSVLVLKNGETVYEEYFSEGSPDRLNNTRSATKTIMAMAVGAAIDRGHVGDVDDKIWPLFDTPSTNNASDLKRDISFQDFLTMSSALHCDDNNDTPGTEDYMHEQQVWRPWALDLPEQPGWQRDAAGLGPFRYCTVGTFLTGQALEEATGQKIDAFVQETIFDPLGITELEWYKSPAGEIQTGGGLELSTRDLGKLGQLIEQRGVWAGQQVLPQAWVDAMTTRHREAFDGMGYGYQIWTRDYALPCGTVSTWSMAGNGGNYVVSVQDHDLVVVLTRTRYNTRTMHPESLEMMEKHILPAAICGA